MFKNCKTTVQQGSIGLVYAIAKYTELGFNVSLPVIDNQSYDLIIDNGNLLKVQVKTTSYKRNDKYLVQLKTVRPNRTTNVISKMKPVDLLFVLTDSGLMYSIPYDKLSSLYEIRLHMYEDFKV